MSIQDILLGLHSLYVEVSELPPQMRNLPCAVANCQQPTVSLVKVTASSAMFFEPTCGNHGSSYYGASGFLREARHQAVEQLQREQEELHQWQQQQQEPNHVAQRQAQSVSRPEQALSPANAGEPRVCPFGHAHVAGDTTFESCVEVFNAIKEYRDRT
jgi:hypothetical protein